MNSLYRSLTKTADDLLKRFGAKVIFTRAVSGVYNPVTGSVEGSSDISFKGFGAALDYKTDQYDGSNIVMGDVRLLVQKMKRQPAIGDVVTLFNGRKYSIISITNTSPAGDLVMSECQLRTGERGSIR
jgi:hypothetical protein